MWPPDPFRPTLHTFRGPRGSSTSGPSRCVHMWPPHPLRHAPHDFRGPREPHRVPEWVRPHVAASPISAHPARVSWPHRELHLKPRWQGSHGGTASISQHPPHVSWPSSALSQLASQPANQPHAPSPSRRVTSGERATSCATRSLGWVLRQANYFLRVFGNPGRGPMNKSGRRWTVKTILDEKTEFLQGPELWGPAH